LTGETVRDQDLDALLGPALAPFKRAVLAVSGGSDSMALMVLFARWIAFGAAPKDLAVEVASVDHGLRPDAAEEAAWVAERARALGFRHTTLVWSGDKPQTRLQERAREARYALLAAHAAAGRTPAAVVTAHTEDDQAETLLMRLGRGSGLDGLSGMAPMRQLFPDGSVQLVRPLLGLSKARLVATLEGQGSAWVDDPSNTRPDFERVRVRQALANRTALGLSNEKLALSAQRLLRAREALEQISDAKAIALVDPHHGVYGEFDRSLWRAEPAELRIRMLTRLLRAFGGDARPALLSQVEALDGVLVRDRPVAQTLGGCMIVQGLKAIRIYRELGVRQLPVVSLRPGEEALWDWRFRVGYAAPGGTNGGDDPEAVSVVVRPLGMHAYATLRPRMAANVRPPARAAYSVPSFWSGERLLGVPSLAPQGQRDGPFSAVFVGLERSLG
jgi:tRNA(Ile)-lysidine synthase